MSPHDDEIGLGVDELNEQVAKIVRELDHSRLGTKRTGISDRR